MKIRLLLVDHEFRPIGRRFSVETSDDDEISDLKKKVKEEKKATFSQYHPMFDTDFLTVWQTGGELVFNRSTTHRQEAILEKIKNNVNDENVFWILEEEVVVATLPLTDGQVLIVRLPSMSTYTADSTYSLSSHVVEMKTAYQSRSAMSRSARRSWVRVPYSISSRIGEC